MQYQILPEVLGAFDGSQPMDSNSLKPKRGRPKDPDIEQRIIRAAQESFANPWFDATTMDELAQKAGTSRTTIFIYFRSKQNLFKAAIDDLLAQLPAASELTSGITGDSIEERLIVIAERGNRLFSSASFKLIRYALASDISPSLRAYIQENTGTPYFQTIADYLSDEAANGIISLEDSKLAAYFFIALIVGPEALRSRWNGSAFSSSDDVHLRGAVQVFIKGHTN